MSKPAKKSHRKLFTVGSDAPFQFTEAYKSLRTNLEFLSASGNCKTILITSSVPEEGKTNVAVNLAITLASSGKQPYTPVSLVVDSPGFDRLIVNGAQIFTDTQTVQDMMLLPTPSLPKSYSRTETVTIPAQTL